MAKKSEFLKAYGTAFQIFKAVTDKVLEIGGSDDDLRRLLKDEDLCRKVAELVVVLPFSASVGYYQPSFEELNRRFPACVDPDYKNKRFDPIERCKAVPTDVGNREVAFEYVHLDRDASADEVLAEMDRKGLRPALYEELLGFAEKYPDEQRKHLIVALGSEASVDGDRRVAYLWGDDSSRDLDMSRLDGSWNGSCRFLAVRLGSPKTVQQGSPQSEVGETAVDDTVEKLRRLVKEVRLPVYRVPADCLTPVGLESNGRLFRAPVTYGQPMGEGLLLESIDRCKDVKREDGEVRFVTVVMDHDPTVDEVLAEMDRWGLRPALCEELLGFADKYYHAAFAKETIVALGSMVIDDGVRKYVYLSDGGYHLRRSDIGWGGLCQFLAVRE